MKSLNKILFIVGCNEGPSKRYRVFNHVEYLKHHSIISEVLWDIDPRLVSKNYLAEFSLVINFRSGFNERIKKFYEIAKEIALPIVYDIDDLVFDPDRLESIDAFNRLQSAAAKNEYRRGVLEIRQALLASDFVTTSTTYLQNYLVKYTGKPVWKIPFGVNARQVQIVDNLSKWDVNIKYIGYLSGTATHQKDFEEVVLALRSILHRHNDVYLKIIGPLDIGNYFDEFSARVQKLPFMDWQDLLIETASLHVALAPFDTQSEFCLAKSELKYVEQGLCSVPTIASAVPSFVEAIKDGYNGYIATKSEDWFVHLDAVVSSSELRNSLGRNARREVLENYSPWAMAKRVQLVYEDILHGKHSGLGRSSVSDGSLKSDERKLSISWIIPQPFEGSGGHRNIFRAIKNLVQFGYRVSLYTLRDNMRFKSGVEVSDFIDEAFFPLNVDFVEIDFKEIRPCDIIISTYWTTAYVAKQNARNASLNVYFIQDFEPMFFPMGTDYVRALQSYRFGFHHITSGPWPLRAIENATGVSGGDYFMFPLDRNIYFPRQSMGPSSKTIAFFARPEMPRRCFDLAVEALKLVYSEDPSVKIVAYGSRSDLLNNLPFPALNLGLTDTIEELADLYRSAAVGICFSTTNPSLVPYEMMACGCPVVDLDINDSVVNYESHDNCVLVSPDAQLIADAILSVLRDKERALKLIVNGLEFVKRFPSELEMARTIEKSILSAYSKALKGGKVRGAI